MRILVIEDDLSICRSIKETMQKADTDVCCMAFGSEALECFMEHKYCLVIMDFQVSGMNGLEMLHVMRAAKHTPILVLTDPLSSDEKANLLRARANALIEKPVDMNVCSAQANTLIQLNGETEEGLGDHQLITFGSDFVIAPIHRQAIIDGEPLALTRKEFDSYVLPIIPVKY